MKRISTVLALLLAWSHVSGAPDSQFGNCGRQVPAFWDEVYEKLYVPDSGRMVLSTGIEAGLREVLTKPINVKFSDVNEWIEGHHIKDFCIFGEPNKREIMIRGQAYLFIPEEFANEDAGGVQVLTVETRFTIDPDRMLIQMDQTNGFRWMDMTLAFRNMIQR